MRRISTINPRELSKSAKFFSMFTIIDLLIIFCAMFGSSFVGKYNFISFFLVAGIIALRKYFNRKHNEDLFEALIKNKKRIDWFCRIKNLKEL